jgi:hypothetical protein
VNVLNQAFTAYPWRYGKCSTFAEPMQADPLFQASFISLFAITGIANATAV